LEQRITILPLRKGENRSEFQDLASSTGMEQNEIDEMIEGDKVFLAIEEGKMIGFIAVSRNVEVSPCFHSVRWQHAWSRLLSQPWPLWECTGIHASSAAKRPPHSP
jgi:hypothetical protein